MKFEEETKCYECGENLVPDRLHLLQGFSSEDNVLCKCPRGHNYGTVAVAELGDLDRLRKEVAAKERRQLENYFRRWAKRDPENFLQMIEEKRLYIYL